MTRHYLPRCTRSYFRPRARESIRRRRRRHDRSAGPCSPRARRGRQSTAAGAPALASSSESFMPVVNGYAFRTAGLVNLQLGHLPEGRGHLRAANRGVRAGCGQRRRRPGGHVLARPQQLMSRPANRKPHSRPPRRPSRSPTPPAIRGCTNRPTLTWCVSPPPQPRPECPGTVARGHHDGAVRQHIGEHSAPDDQPPITTGIAPKSPRVRLQTCAAVDQQRHDVTR